MNIFKKRDWFPDFEFDVEGLNVFAIDYDEKHQEIKIEYILINTYFEFTAKATLDQHNKLIERFRKKKGLI